MIKKNFLGKMLLKNLYKQGKSRKWLADEIGLTPSAISAIITGRTNPSPKTLKSMSDVLNINIDQLIDSLHF